jgi:hypothetical protein
METSLQSGDELTGHQKSISINHGDELMAHPKSISMNHGDELQSRDEHGDPDDPTNELIQKSIPADFDELAESGSWRRTCGAPNNGTR